MNLNLFAKATLVAFSLAVGAPLALAGYEFHVPVAGLLAANVATPNLTGSGTSKVGGCTQGQSGCLELPVISTGSISTLGAPRLTVAAGTCHSSAACTVAPTKAYSSGKWYWEAGLISSAENGNYCFGAGHPNTDMYSSVGGLMLCVYASSVALYEGTTGISSFPISGPVGRMFGFALDMDNRKLDIYNNGGLLVSRTLPAGQTSFTAVVGNFYNVSTNTHRFNFGQTNFMQAVPAGYNAGLW